MFYNIQNHLFLSGWGFKASLWQVFHPEISAKQCVDMPCFASANQEQVLQYLSVKLAKTKVIHAWSHSGLWLLKLIQQNKLEVKDKSIYCYGLPLLWQFASAQKQQAFVRQYELNPNKLSQKFLKLITFPKFNKLEDLMPYCLLPDAEQYHSQLNYLKWMFAFTETMTVTDAVALCKKTGINVFLAENDSIVNSVLLAKLFNSKLIKDHSHLELLHCALNEAGVC
ncbi:hypothetical protein [Cysteiniphilum halobium]|uniref:hypothetical protein n=1 Tax=Cysteiniphilum halobium TaxID=2219059 RepID=UPI000E650141|nr:hypothetical protein [Cysteiniphilum halobium]